MIPVKITSSFRLNQSVYEPYFKSKKEIGEKHQILFDQRDLELPFQTANESMWPYLEPELNRRISDLEVDESFAAEVREILVDLLPKYQFNAGMVSERLGISTRTLQRKLQAEGTSFQQQLNHTRELMAKTYLANVNLSIEEIAYLLGYQDVSSFQRAFGSWTSMNPTEYRKNVLNQ